MPPQVHAKAAGALSLCSSGALLASGSADGSLALRPAGLTSTSGDAGPARDRPHDMYAGGMTAVAFDATGAYLLSAGEDGSVFLHAAAGSAHVQAPACERVGAPAVRPGRLLGAGFLCLAGHRLAATPSHGMLDTA